MRIAVTGSHGLIGTALVRRAVADGHEVIRLVRGRPGPGEAVWDPEAGTVATGALDGVDAVVHLAGAGIGDRRWNAAHKERILRSRVSGTQTIARAVAEAAAPRPVLVSGSAVGYYGTGRGADVLTEEDPAGTDFLAGVCAQWEAATAPAREAGARVVNLRTGLVLSAAGGVLGRQLTLFRLGLGARLGDGRQYQSWITRRDHVSAILHALRTDSLSGPVNAVAPIPVTNAVLTATLARVLRRPAFLVLPAPLLRTALGREMADETLLAGQRAAPARLVASGFSFEDPELPAALEVALADRVK